MPVGTPPRRPVVGKFALLPLAFMPLSLGTLCNPRGPFSYGGIPDAELELPDLRTVAPAVRASALRTSVRKIEAKIARAERDCVRDAPARLPYGTMLGGVLTITLVMMSVLPTIRARVVGAGCTALFFGALYGAFSLAVVGTSREGCRRVGNIERDHLRRIMREASPRSADTASDVARLDGRAPKRTN